MPINTLTIKNIVGTSIRSNQEKTTHNDPEPGFYVLRYSGSTLPIIDLVTQKNNPLIADQWENKKWEVLSHRNNARIINRLFIAQKLTIK